LMTGRRRHRTPQAYHPPEPVVVFGLESLVFRSSHLIDRLSQVLGDTELVVHQLRIRGLVRDRIRIGREHVGSHSLDLLPLLEGQGLQHRLHGGLSSLGSDVQYSRAVDVGEDGDVVVPFTKALLIDPDVGNRLQLASLKAPFDCPIHDLLGRVPGQSDEGSGSIDGTVGLQDFDREGVEEQGETAVLSGPRRHDRLHPVVRAAAPTQPGDQLRRELHRVAMPPALLVRVIGKAAGLVAFRAGNARTNVRQADFDSPLIKAKVNSIDSPGVVEAQKPGIVPGKCVNPRNLRRRRPRNDQPVPRNSPKHPYPLLDQDLKHRPALTAMACTDQRRFEFTERPRTPTFVDCPEIALEERGIILPPAMLDKLELLRAPIRLAPRLPDWPCINDDGPLRKPWLLIG
jgi:hypothetical protein